MGKSKKGRAHSKGNRKDLLGDKPRPKETGADAQPQAHYLLNEVSHHAETPVRAIGMNVWRSDRPSCVWVVWGS